MLAWGPVLQGPQWLLALGFLVCIMYCGKVSYTSNILQFSIGNYFGLYIKLLDPLPELNILLARLMGDCVVLGIVVRERFRAKVRAISA